jgi:ABC-type sugar transport system ATPase subunit
VSPAGGGSPALLQARGISKAFGHVQALSDVDFAVHEGEVVALVGDNGAGKSTLMKVLCGAHRPDRGSLTMDGEEVVFRSPADTRDAGIAVVYQDLALVDTRDVARNMFLGREPRRGLVLDRGRMLRESRATLDRLRIRVPSVRAPVSVLSGGQRQAVAIARAIHQGGRLVIMDEPTAALGVEQQRNVLRLIEDLHAHGTAVVMVSHNLAHVFDVCGRIVVMRAGRIAGVRPTADTTPEQIVQLIVGAADFSVAGR